MKIKILLLSVLILLIKMSFPKNVELIKNSIKEIEIKKGKIVLKKIREFGSYDDSHIKENYFKNPTDIAIDNVGNIYIADTILNCIKVFDKKGEFIRIIGKKGQGPGDLLSPLALGFDEDYNLIIREYGNRRIQILSKTGKYISSYRSFYWIAPCKILGKNKILYSSYTMAKKNKRIADLSIKGKRSKFIGKGISFPEIYKQKNWKYDQISHISFNKQNAKIYFVWDASQMIQVFDIGGKFERSISYDTNLNQFKYNWDDKKKNFMIDKISKDYSYCVGLDIDNKGRIFIVVSDRASKEKELIVIRRTPSNIMEVPVSKEYPDSTDLYCLLIFDKKGKIIAKKQLDFYCNRIKIHRDNIFFVDKIFDKVVYQYRYNIVK